MEEEVVNLSKLADVGVSLLIVLVFLYAVIKLIPNWIRVWQTAKEAEQKRKEEEQKSMQSYYDERNKTYQAQMEIMNRQSEQQSNLIGQATQVIARSNEVIAGNTEALKHNTAMHQKVQDALSVDYAATKEVAANLKAHDERAQKIYTIGQRIFDKVDTIATKEE